MSTPIPGTTNVLPLRPGTSPAAAVNAAPAPGPAPDPPRAKIRDKDNPKLRPAGEPARRRVTAWLAGGSFGVFLVLAILNVVQQRALIPIPFGSGLLVEAAVAAWPDVWIIGAIHNGCLALASATILVCCTVAHTDPPGNPNSRQVQVWRRQAPFCVPSLLACVGLLVCGVKLAAHGLPMLGGFVDDVCAAFALRAAVQVLIPLARTYFVAETDPDGGVGTRFTIGGGWRQWRHGELRVFHEDLLSAQKIGGLCESCFGLATLRLRFRGDDGEVVTIDLPALGSPELVQQIAYWLSGDFQLGRTFDVKKFPEGYKNQVVTTNFPAGTPHP